MRLLLSLTLLWAPPLSALLLCHTCDRDQCSSTGALQCPPGAMCITAAVQVASPGASAQTTFRGCASSSLCPAAGAHTFSGNLGVSRAVASVSCCNTPLCNLHPIAFPAARTENGLQCFSCDAVTSQCTAALQCKGEEDRCFQARVKNGSTTSPALGCASANLCAAASSLGFLPFLSNVGDISSGPACCGSSFCNALNNNNNNNNNNTITTT